MVRITPLSWDFIPNPGTLLHDPGTLFQILGLYSKSWDFTPPPWDFIPNPGTLLHHPGTLLHDPEDLPPLPPSRWIRSIQRDVTLD